MPARIDAVKEFWRQSKFQMTLRRMKSRMTSDGFVVGGEGIEGWESRPKRLFYESARGIRGAIKLATWLARQKRGSQG